MSDVLLKQSDGSRGALVINGLPYLADEDGNYAVPAEIAGAAKAGGVPLDDATNVSVRDLPNPTPGDQYFDTEKSRPVYCSRMWQAYLGLDWAPVTPVVVCTLADAYALLSASQRYAGMCLFTTDNPEGGGLGAERPIYMNSAKDGYVYATGAAVDLSAFVTP